MTTRMATSTIACAIARACCSSGGADSPRESVVVGLVGRFDRLVALVPARVIAPHRRPGLRERMATVELEGPLVGILNALSGHGLERRGRERACQLGDVRASAHAAEQL